MKAKYELFIVLALCTVYSLGQDKVQQYKSSFLESKIQNLSVVSGNNNNIFIGPSLSNVQNRTNVFFSSNEDVINQKIIPDSAYYQHITKCNGWWQGIGPKLTKEEASKLNCYYKMSKKNAAGNWTFIQAYNGYGKLTTYHSIGTYLANQWDDQDKGLNKDWKEKLQQVCQWEFIGNCNSKGDEVIQERGLNASGNIMFAYSPVKINDSTYVGTFTDSWGMPIYMRTDSLGNDKSYANFVQIVRDKRGYEVLYKFTDRNGIPQKNKDGAYMNRRAYDDAGNQIMEASLGITGKRMIDDYGNCGWGNTYDSIGNIITANYFDAEWNPIRIPTKRGNTDNIYGYWFEYDKFGRETKRGFLDKDGNHDVNQFGSNKIEQEYNEHGVKTKYVSYDMNGNKIACDSLGTAEAIYEIDKNGYFTLTETRDAKGNLINNAYGVCKKTWTYDGDTELAETEYQAIGDSVHKTFDFERDSIGNEQRIWYEDNFIRVDSVDKKGNETLLAYYDLTQHPINKFGYHKRISTYQNGKHTSFRERKWFDKDGNWAIEKYENGSDNGFTSEELFTDSIKYTLEKKQYLNGKIKQCFAQIYDLNFAKILNQYDITPYGEHTRVGWWDNLHYNVLVDYDFRGNLRSFIGTNEFDEPSYISVISNNTVYYYLSFNNGKDIFFDEDGKEIPTDSMANFRYQLPKAFCIEVTDTAIGYSCGIRNGDIILSFGDWHTSEDLKSNLDYFYLEAILKNEEPKQMTVLRHHPKNKTSEILTLQLGKGSPSELGFYAHQICYTQKEKERLLNYANAYSFKYDNDSHEYDHQIVLGYAFKGSLSDSYFYWTSSHKDPFAILYCEQHPYKIKKLVTWSWEKDSLTKWTKRNIIGANYDGIKKMYYSEDFVSTKSYEWEGSVGIKLFSVNVNDSIYNKMAKLYTEWYANKPK